MQDEGRENILRRFSSSLSSIALKRRFFSGNKTGSIVLVKMITMIDELWLTHSLTLSLSFSLPIFPFSSFVPNPVFSSFLFLSSKKRKKNYDQDFNHLDSSSLLVFSFNLFSFFSPTTQRPKYY